MTIGAGLVERGDDGKLYNTYVVAMPDGTWAVHRKLHVFEHADICAGRPVHRLRHAARLPRRGADLLRQQHRRERAGDRAARRRDPARAAPDGRLQLGEPAAG